MPFKAMAEYLFEVFPLVDIGPDPAKTYPGRDDEATVGLAFEGVQFREFLGQCLRGEEPGRVLRAVLVVLKGLEAPIFAHMAADEARLPGAGQVRQQIVIHASWHQGAVDN